MHAGLVPYQYAGGCEAVTHSEHIIHYTQLRSWSQLHNTNFSLLPLCLPPPIVLFRVNVGCGPAEERVLLTGLHAVADIYCENCKTTLGWKYVSVLG